MDGAPRTPAGIPDKAASTNRIEALSDGVFAVALTLLVLDIKVPESPVSNGLAGALPDLLPRIGIYAVSFILVGFTWIWHHLIFGLIQKSTRTLLWLNLLVLLPIGFLPFCAALVAKYSTSSVAIAIYGLDITAFSLVVNILWRYARREGLIADETDDRTHTRTSERAALFAALCVGSTVIGVLFPQAGLLLFLLVPVGYVFTGGRHTTGS